MQENDPIMQRLNDVGAVLTNDHFVFTSGKHGGEYVNKDKIYPHVELTSTLCLMIAREFCADNVQTVIGPENGAIVLSTWTTHWLNRLKDNPTDPDVMFTYAEKEGDDFTIKRGYDEHIRGKRVLVVEDLLNTGGSARKTVEAVRRAGGTVVGLGVLCDRGNVTKAQAGDVPKLYSIVSVDMIAYEALECPLCRCGVPINTKVGHGKKFMAERIG